MKKIISMLFLFTMPFALQAQLNKRIKRAAKQTVENKAAQKTAETVDDGIDKSIDAVKGLFSKKKNDRDTGEQNEMADKEQPGGSSNASSPADTAINDFAVFSKFTFIPGDKVLFYDDFSLDAAGDFPVNWETGGSGEVVKLGNDPGNWLSLQRRSGYVPTMPAALPENYTIEFDLVTNGYGKSGASSKLHLGFVVKKAYSMGQAGSSADIELLLSRYFTVNRVSNFGSEAKIKVGTNIVRQLPELTNARMHISIAVNKQRLRCWINEEKYVDVPSILQGNMGKYFIIEAMDVRPENGQFAAISNFRIAETGEDLRSKLMKDGKFSTSGIFFNTNAAMVKKESYGVMKSIANLLKSDNNIKLQIVGHTDDVGNNASNQELSVRRAEAVKNILVKEFQIEESRLQFSGKGETTPIDDNTTEKGRANNRRVEFIKF